MKKYLIYKNSGLEWTGDVPSHWNISRLDTLCELKKDTISKEELNGQSVFHYSIPVIQETGDGAIENGDTIDSNKFLVHGNEVLFSKLNPRKETIVITKIRSKLKHICSSEFLVIKPIKINLDFLYFLLRSYSVKERICSKVQSATKSHQRAIPEDIIKMWHAIPPIEEQIEISNFLKRKLIQIEDIVFKKQNLINLLREERLSLINKAVTKGIVPKIKMKDSTIKWIGEMPANWRSLKLKYCLSKITGGGTPATENPIYWNGEIPWVSAKDMKVEKNIEDSIDKITYEAISNSSTNLLKPGCVLIVVRSGILKHSLPLAINTVALTINQDLKALEVNDFISNEFLFWQLKGRSFEILSTCNKMGATVDSIEMTDLLNFKLCIPDKAEQKKIVDHIEKETSRIDLAIEKMLNEIDLLDEYKTSLINDVISGQVYVLEKEVMQDKNNELVNE